MFTDTDYQYVISEAWHNSETSLKAIKPELNIDT